jgi:heme oxygenase
MPAPQSRRELLRRATADAHARIDALLSAGLADRRAYAAYLRGMQRFLRESEATLDADGALASIARGREHLDSDLRMLGIEPLPAPHAGGIAAMSALPEALGWQYVVAGSALGARFLLREARALGLDGARGAAFLHHHAAGDDWAAFLARLEQAPLSPDDLPQMCAAARHAFAAAHAAMHAAQQEMTA